MKNLIFFFLLLFFVPVWANNLEDTPLVTIQNKSISIKDALKSMEQQSKVHIMYQEDLIDKTKRLDLNLKNVTLRNALDAICIPAKLKYEFVDNYVLITRAQNVTIVPVASDKPIVITGIVLDEKSEPLPGVSVRLKETNEGTICDNNGEFRYVLATTVPSQTLIFSFLGYGKKEVVVKDPSQRLVVSLNPVDAELETVVVTGYGNISKGNYTGAATTVKAEDILLAGVASIDEMLQGIVPGMLVQTVTGQVGASPKIRVRGTSTILGNQEPVWVVDGVIQQDPQPFNVDDNTAFSVSEDDIRRLAGNAISWLNPIDIETITVLKDASATAIYGSKAANGVIVITTKKAYVGKISLQYSGDLTIGQRPNYSLYDRMNSKEIMQFSKEMYEERVSYPSQIVPMGYPGLIERLVNKNISETEFVDAYKKMAGQNTDWFDILFRNSVNQAHTISLSGGSEILQNRTSFGYNEMKGEAIGNDMTTFTASTNTTLVLGSKLTASLQLNGTSREVNGFAYGTAPYDYAYNTTRILPAYNDDGSYAYHEKWTTGVTSTAITNKRSYNYNILNELDNTNSANNTRTWNAAVNVKWIIIPGLQYQGTYSYASSSATTKKYATEQSFHITQYRGFEYGSVGSTAPEMGMTKLPFGGILETGNTTTSTFVARNAFVYDHIFKDEHRMTLQAGLETQSVNMDGGTNLRYGYLHFRGETFATPPKDYLPVGASATTTPTDNSATVYGSATALNKIDNKISEYATAVYIFRDRYVVNGSARLDASNRFGQDYNKRFAPTWSVGVKWRAGREEFLHKNASWIDHLDFLASYGYQGNAVQSVSPHLIANNPGLVGLGNYYQQYILRIRSLPYPNLGWEKTKTWNIGAELSLFNGRIGFEGNYFKKTSNVLSSRDIGYENGMANGLVSGSTMTNTGYDFTVTMTPIRTRDFSWQLSVNTAVVRNKIEKNGRVNNINDYTAGTCIVEGEPYSTFYSYAFTGLNPADGTPLFNNIEVTGLDGPMDFLIKSGKFTPDFSGGLNTQLRYKNIALYALFYVQLGGERRLPKLYDVTSNNGTPTPEHNLSNRLTQRWQKPGDEEFTDIPSIPGVGATQVYLPLTQTSTRTLKNPYDLYNLSDQQTASSDMIRCRSISLSYDVNVARLKGLDRLQIRVSMTNPFLYAFSSKWRGVDPETGDWPARRTTSLSLQMMF